MTCRPTTASRKEHRVHGEFHREGVSRNWKSFWAHVKHRQKEPEISRASGARKSSPRASLSISPDLVITETRRVTVLQRKNGWDEAWRGRSPYFCNYKESKWKIRQTHSKTVRTRQWSSVGFFLKPNPRESTQQRPKSENLRFQQGVQKNLNQAGRSSRTICYGEDFSLSTVVLLTLVETWKTPSLPAMTEVACGH